MIRPRRMRWAGHVVQMGKKTMHIEYSYESQNFAYLVLVLLAIDIIVL
jgi:hypothetical protein